MSSEDIKALFERSIELKQALIAQDKLTVLDEMGEQIAQSIVNGGKMLLCGNGGSAADAQHLAAEMLVRLRPDHNREGVAALALTQDVSTITACGNDFGYDALFERLTRTLGNEGDVLIAITTSGKSPNILRAQKAARELGMKTFGFLGCDGGPALELCDKAFLVPSNETGRIQESHITAGHALMENIENRLIANGFLNLQK